MPLTQNEENELLSPWIAHFLALVAFLTLVVAAYRNLFVLEDGEIYRVDPFVGVPLTVAIFWFMGWMAVDVVGGRRTSRRAAWLVFMFLVPIFSSLIYYLFYWQPAKNTIRK